MRSKRSETDWRILTSAKALKDAIVIKKTVMIISFDPCIHGYNGSGLDLYTSYPSPSRSESKGSKSTKSLGRQQTPNTPPSHPKTKVVLLSPTLLTSHFSLLTSHIFPTRLINILLYLLLTINFSYTAILSHSFPSFDLAIVCFNLRCSGS